MDTHPDIAGAGIRAGYHWRELCLRQKIEFDQVFAENQRARTDYVMVMARPNQVGFPRLGMIVAKRLLGRAVDRNRVKRCVRESFRQALPELPACDFVVRLLSKPLPGDEARDLMRTFKRAGQRAVAKWPAAPINPAAIDPAAQVDSPVATPVSPPN